MGLIYRLEDYGRYRDAVGAATCVEISRRGDPARSPAAWDHLAQVLDRYGAPWIAQLWTKDVRGTLALGGSLIARLRDEGTTVTAQVTVTGLAGSVWEPGVPQDVIPYLADLSDALGGPEHIAWRYDPIIPTVHTTERFARLAHEVAEQGVRRGVINFVAAPGRYHRVDHRLAPLLEGWSAGMPGYDAAWREAIARAVTIVAAGEGISLACCAESSVLAGRVPGLRPAACADGAWFAGLSGRYPWTNGAVPAAPPRGRSRPGCGCIRYFDVGDYGGWSHCCRCAYCYAG